MQIILGFGCTEEQIRAEVKNMLVGAILRGDSVNSVLKKWNDQADIFDKQPRGVAPERYTRIWYYDNKLHFHHINRTHPFSPDGWALLQIEEDFGKEEKDAPLETMEQAGTCVQQPQYAIAAGN